MIVKAFKKNAPEEYETMPEKIFEGNLTNKINLERMRKIKIEF